MTTPDNGFSVHIFDGSRAVLTGRKDPKFYDSCMLLGLAICIVAVAVVVAGAASVGAWRFALMILAIAVLAVGVVTMFGATFLSFVADLRKKN